MIATSFLLTACFSDTEEDEPETEAGVAMLTLELPSDSANDITWEFEQNAEVFQCEDIFLEDEGAEEGSSELQTFTLTPGRSGEVTIRFINKSTETVYTYECEVLEDSGDIKVNSSKGESAGSEVEPPNVVIERD